MRSGSSARGRRARASQRERSQSAAGSQSGRTRGGGWRERRGASGTSAFSFSAPQELEQLGRGDPGWPPRYVPAEPRAPTWHSWDLPATTAGLTGSGLGLSPRIPLAEAAWWARRDPLRRGYPTLSPVLLASGLLLAALCSGFLPQCSGHSLWECGLRIQGSPFLGRGTEAPIRE